MRQIHPYSEVLFEDSYEASRDKEVVEYALSRSLSPTMIAEYKTMLLDKKLLQTKLHEFYQIFAPLENRAGKEKSE